MEEPDSAQVIKDLHSDLAWKYAKYGATIETFWRSFDKRKRTKCMKDGSRNGEVLKHSLDASLGNVCKFIPEWNLRDITDPNSGLLLSMLRHRATTSLVEQYCDSPDG